MEYRTLDITVISAKDLSDVNLFSKMDVYAVATLAGDPRTKQKTPVDKDGGKNPKWNHPMKFIVDEAAAQQNRLNLEFELRCDRTLGDKDIGFVQISVKELLDNLGDGKSAQYVNYQVRKPSGKAKGELNFSYKFGEKVAATSTLPKGQEPVTAYPAPAPATATAYPPPGPSSGYPPAGGYGYPPPGQYPAPMPGYGYPPPGQYPAPAPGYGYPPPHPGYGYPPPVQAQQPAKKNKFGMGLGAGLLGGALGGLLIGDMVSDAAYDGGYDGGFDDGGGFDF